MRFRLMIMALALLWAPSLALAGGAGNIKLARPIAQAAAGEVVIYLQALQHGVHPLADAKVSVSGVGPNGAAVTVQAALDPAYGSDSVFVARLPLTVTGRWALMARAEHWVSFPELPFEVEVVAKGTKLPDPGPVTPYHDGAAHDHAAAPVPEPAPANSAAPPGAPGRDLGLKLAAGAGVAVVGVLGLVAWRRRSPRTR